MGTRHTLWILTEYSCGTAPTPSLIAKDKGWSDLTTTDGLILVKAVVIREFILHTKYCIVVKKKINERFEKVFAHIRNRFLGKATFAQCWEIYRLYISQHWETQDGNYILRIFRYILLNELNINLWLIQALSVHVEWRDTLWKKQSMENNGIHH